MRNDEKWLSPQELGELLNIPLQSIYRWRYSQQGPSGYRIGRHVRYRASDVEAWLSGQRDERAEASHA